MPEQFLHGVEVVELPGGQRPIRTVKSSVIGLIGTAPDADTTAFPENQPVLVANNRTLAGKLDTVGSREGTLPSAIEGIFDQAGAMVIVVRVAEGADEAETLTNVVGTGTGFEGVHAFLASENETGFKPRILIAPGWTHQRPSDSANPVVAEMVAIAERLRSIVVADGPNTDNAAAITAAGDSGSERVFLVDPNVSLFRDGAVVSEPTSARVAGLIAKTDAEKGFWWSPSNQEILGIVGTDRAIDFNLGDSNCAANALNENNIATVIRHNGFRLWGNRTLSSDSTLAFLNVVRTKDMINDSILAGHLWAVDRNITKTYLEDVAGSVNAYLRNLKARGAILGGRCWPDPDLNSPTNVQAGKVYFNFDFTPPAPAEHVTFRSKIVNDYLADLI